MPQSIGNSRVSIGRIICHRQSTRNSRVSIGRIICHRQSIGNSHVSIGRIICHRQSIGNSHVSKNEKGQEHQTLLFRKQMEKTKEPQPKSPVKCSQQEPSVKVYFLFSSRLSVGVIIS